MHLFYSYDTNSSCCITAIIILPAVLHWVHGMLCCTISCSLSYFRPTYNPYPKYSSRFFGVTPSFRTSFTNFLYAGFLIYRNNILIKTPNIPPQPYRRNKPLVSSYTLISQGFSQRMVLVSNDGPRSPH